MNVLALHQDESGESGEGEPLVFGGRKAGNQEAMAAAEVSRLGSALHFARRTYSNRFARIRTTKSQRERRSLGFTLVMRAPEEKGREG